ncbi:hypothetical protein A2801_02370 [Candidatus Woesebacteria bacterium RIFCSPHIGHO2_01_FULL_41_10]|uniref:Uncharacterized protein n=1 Tax=Candidatus Woesebacteria bacterium RIFCSPHIGHO2_01_FULL_41_10 TaxID=1802500 RepID=A0A1F7YPV3_9BACT|nr:MAG: hypothetical protein A2801_02370 [Candidatus Woesebacteria bacterium RIFCSPHIGHO2_01_FULL_41_10]
MEVITSLAIAVLTLTSAFTPSTQVTPVLGQQIALTDNSETVVDVEEDIVEEGEDEDDSAVGTIARERRAERFEAVETRREEIKTKAEERRTELQENLQNLRDERKQTVVERVMNRIEVVNERAVAHWNRVLDRLSQLLEKIESRSQKVEDSGGDIGDVTVAIANAQAAIDEAQAAVDAQELKTYNLEIGDDTTVGEDVSGVIDQLHADLDLVKESVQSARDSIRKVFNALKTAADTIPSDSGE